MASYPTAPTAKMPMPGGATQLRLIKALEDNESLYELGQELPRLARDLKGNHGTSISKTCESIEKDELTGWPMVILLHSMSRKAIKAIIYGTIAFDKDSRDTWYETPSGTPKGAGVYVIGLARQGYGGKFLNEKELEDLISGLEKYKRGSAAINVPAGTKLSSVQKDEKAWVMAVDGIFPEPGQARFMSKPGDENMFRELIEGLRRRLTRLDATKSVRQVQSPLYVGCSGDLRERINGYHRGLGKANRPLCLTVSVLEALGLSMEVVIRVVIRTWKEGQLPLGERLVTTLAGSLIAQSGFNATQAGANPGRVNQAILDSGLDEVERNDFLESHARLTASELDRRNDFLGNLEEAHDLIGTISAKVKECERVRKQLDERKLATPGDILRALTSSRRALLQELDLMSEQEKLVSFASLL